MNKEILKPQYCIFKPTLESPETCSVLGSSGHPILPLDARGLIAGGEGVRLGAHERRVLPVWGCMHSWLCGQQLCKLSLKALLEAGEHASPYRQHAAFMGAQAHALSSGPH